MAWVTQHLIDVWNSGEFVGENTPHAVVQVQLGHWILGWNDWAQNPDRFGFEPKIGAQIWGEGLYGGTDAQPPHEGWWSGHWIPTEGYPAGVWHTVPNVVSIKRTKDLAQRGITVLEVVVDALDYEQRSGALGDAYHVLVPGALAPDRNYIGPTRPDPGWELTQWAPDGQESRIQDSVAIRVWQGYGLPQTAAGNTPPTDGGSNGAWTFRGMIDDVDIDGDPNQMTVTARNGKLLTDERVFRAAKSVQLKDPVTFYDSRAAIDLKLVGSGARGSSQSDTDDHAAKNVLDTKGNQWDITAARYSTAWQSDGNIDGDSLEWIEIRLPQGNYKSVWLQTEPGLTAYVGIYARRLQFWSTDAGAVVLEEEQPTKNGSDIDVGWIGGTSAPGAHGGWPYITSVTTGTTLPARYTITGATLDRIDLGGTYEVGKHSILRVGLIRPGGPSRRVAVGDLHAVNRVVDKEIRGQQFILVDDASDVVKVVLRWAGYHSWDVEQANVRLSDGTNYGPGVKTTSSGRLTFNRTQNLIEIIEELEKQLGWIFFIADPVDGNSDGIPTFRRDSSLLTDSSYIAAELDEDTMLTGLRRKSTDEDKPYIIRVRGKTASVRGGGVPLGGDSVRRIMAGYHCPWSAGSRMGGILRHITYQDDQLVTYAMCLFGCLRIAMQAALAMHVATAEIPAHPLLELDDQVSVIDEPTATNSRMWIVKSEDTMQLGENPQWRQTLEGALLDNRDLQEVIAQCLGHAPMTVSAPAPDFTTVVDSIDWNHVQNPFRVADGESGWSSYPPPILVLGRQPAPPRLR